MFQQKQLTELLKTDFDLSTASFKELGWITYSNLLSLLLSFMIYEILELWLESFNTTKRYIYQFRLKAMKWSMSPESFKLHIQKGGVKIPENEHPFNKKKSAVYLQYKTSLLQSTSHSWL